MAGGGEREQLVAHLTDAEGLNGGVGDAPALGPDLRGPPARRGADAAGQDPADPAVGDEIGGAHQAQKRRWVEAASRRVAAGGERRQRELSTGAQAAGAVNGD